MQATSQQGCRNTDRGHIWMALLALPEGKRADRPLTVYEEGTEGNSQGQGMSTITMPVSATVWAPISAMVSWMSIFCASSSGNGMYTYTVPSLPGPTTARSARSG